MKYSTKHLREYQGAVNAGFDPNLLLSGKFNANQLHELRVGKENGIDTSVYTSPKISSEKMRTARKLMELGVEVKPETLEVYNDEQLEEIRLGEKFGIDTGIYSNPELSADDMKYLRLLELAQKIMVIIKEKSLEFFDSIRSKFQQFETAEVEKQAPLVKNQQLESVVLNLFKSIDFDKIETMDDLAESIQEKLLKGEVQSEVEKEVIVNDEAITSVYTVIDKAEIYGEKLAVLQKVSTGEYLLVHDFEEMEIDLSWTEEIACDSKEMAGTLYQEAILEKIAEKLDANIKVEAIAAPLSEVDQKVQEAINEITAELKVGDLKYVDEFINSIEGNLTMEEKMNAYLQADSINFRAYDPASQDIPSLKGQFAQTYLSEIGLTDSLKAQGLYDCLNFDDYGQMLMEKENFVLTEKGYYSAIDLHKYNLDQVKDVLTDHKVMQTNIPMSLDINTVEDFEATEVKFNEAIKNYIEMDVKNPLSISLNVGDKTLLSNVVLTNENAKMLLYKTTLSRSTLLKELLEDRSIDYNEELTTLEAEQLLEMPATPVSI